MKNIRKQICLLGMIVTCLMSTGCLRIMTDAMGHSLSKGAYTSYAGDTFFYGTKLVGATLQTPLAPIGIVDLPFELVIDVVVLPFQCVDAKGMHQRRLERIAKMEPVYLAREGLLDDFKLRLESMSTSHRCSLVDSLAHGETVTHGRRIFKFIRVMCEYDPACFEYLLNSRHSLYHVHYKVYQYLFRRGFSARNVQREYAVYFAMVSSWGSGSPRQLKMIKLLIDNGCNPNAMPPEWKAVEHGDGEMTPLDFALKDFERYRTDQYKDKTPLDLALSQMENYRRQYGDNPPNKMKEDEMRCSEKLIKMLRDYGAKTSDELKGN